MKRIQDILRRDAQTGRAPHHLLKAWLGYYGLSMGWLAELCGVTIGTLSATLRGSRTSRPVLECIERETGIPADSWNA